MDANAKLDAPVPGYARVALDHAGLHLDGTANGVDHAAELDEAAVPGLLDNAPVVRVDRGVDQIAPQSPEPGERAILVGARKPGVADARPPGLLQVCGSLTASLRMQQRNTNF